MNRDELVFRLTEGGEAQTELFAEAAGVRNRAVGETVYLRGLIELSNICIRDCLYCGIRSSNSQAERYDLTDEEVLAAARYAWQEGYGSIVIQAGERRDEVFIRRIESLVDEVKSLSNGELGITLSIGEQTRETYRRWFRAGAHRYLLRIETSSLELYARIHPSGYTFGKRLEALESLRAEGYQVGTGVMVGLPGQTPGDLADDLLFFKRLDIDMCGMGPYIEHPETPLAALRTEFSRPERFELTLRMIALLRLLMSDINIAASTALHALHPQGRELGIAAGANVIMPNLTPTVQREKYLLYEQKPLDDLNLEGFGGCLVRDGSWGDSKRFEARHRKSRF